MRCCDVPPVKCFAWPAGVRCAVSLIFRDNALEVYSLERIAQEMSGAQQALGNLLGVDPRTFAYPCGHTTVGRGTRLQSYIPLVAERFLVDRGWRELRHNSPEYCDLAHIPSCSCDLIKWLS